MIAAHVIIWTVFIVSGIFLWLTEEYGKGSRLNVWSYVIFILSIYGVALSVFAGFIKLLMILVGID